jgi:hypothetical protein
MDNSVKIIKGEERWITAYVKDEKGNPFNLTNNSEIEVTMAGANGTPIKLTKSPVGGISASAEYEGVIFTADLVGEAGNTISISPDGIKDLDTLVGDWNTANPLNTISHSGLDGSLVVTSGSFTLSGGEDAIISVIIEDAILGKLKFKLEEVDTLKLRVGENQSFYIKLVEGASTRIVNYERVLHVKSPSL